MVIVVDDELGKLARLQCEFFRRAQDGTLDLERAFTGLQQLIQDCAFPLSGDQPNSEWKIVRDFAAGQFFLPSQLDLVSFLEKGEAYIGVVTLECRAGEMGADLGQRHAQHILNNRDQIPEEWRQYILVFPGTAWRDSIMYHRIPCLAWQGKWWDMHFLYSSAQYDNRHRLLRPKSAV